MNISKKKGLILLVLGAFALRALFTLYGAPIYYGMPAPYCYSFGDALSYMWSAENFLNNGHYTFDYLEPDAAFGRLPGYPIFYGLHYLVFGPVRAIYATAWSQVVIDSFVVLLVFGIMRRLAPRSQYAPWVGAILYATYPFIIFWVPMVYTELLSTDVTLLVFYAMLRYNGSRWAAFGLGLLVAVSLFMREYLGLLLPIGMLWVVWQHGGLGRRPAWVAAILVGLGFATLYLGWPVRNYLNYHRVVLLKPKTAGYASHKADLDEFRSWVHCWTNDENPWIDQVAKGTGPINFPAFIFANPAEQAEAQRLVTEARRCGSSFFMQREATNSTRYGLKQEKAAATAAAAHPHDKSYQVYDSHKSMYRSIYTVYRDTAYMMHDATYLFYRNHNCNAEVGDGFKQLRMSYEQRKPVAYWLDVPGANLFKAVFKSLPAGQMNGGGAQALVVRLLFGYRSLLLLIGLAAFWVHRRQRAMWPIAIYTGTMFLFICLIMRNLEMRYLLQADVLMLLPAAVLLGELADRWLNRRPAPAQSLPAEAA